MFFNIYNTFANFIRDLSPLIFSLVMAVCFIVVLVLFIVFLKANDSKSSKDVSRLGILLLIGVVMAICVCLIIIRQ